MLDHDKPLSTVLVVDIELTALTSPIVRVACRWVQLFLAHLNSYFIQRMHFTSTYYILSLTIIYISIRML